MSIAGWELWGPVLFGLAGVAIWFLATYADGSDDRVVSIFSDVWMHSRTLLIAFLFYVVAVVCGYEAEGKITFFGCFGLGYTAHSLFEKFVQSRKGPPRADA